MQFKEFLFTHCTLFYRTLVGIVIAGIYENIDVLSNTT